MTLYFINRYDDFSRKSAGRYGVWKIRLQDRMQNGTESLLDVALPFQIDEHLSCGSSTCLFAPSTLKTRRRRLSSTTRGIIRDFGEEPERSKRGRERGAQTRHVPVRHSIIHVIDPSVLLVHSISARRNERGCERHPARRFSANAMLYVTVRPSEKLINLKSAPKYPNAKVSIAFL